MTLEKLAKALKMIRDPGGDGKTRVSHEFTGEPLKCVRCHMPTKDQPAGHPKAAPPHCVCK